MPDYGIPPLGPMMADTGRLIEVTARTGYMYVIPAHGYLEAIELRFTPPAPNMDMGSPIRFIIEPVDQPRPMQVFARVRDAYEPHRP